MNRASRLAASALLLAGALPAVAQDRRPSELPDPLLVRAREPDALSETEEGHVP